MSSYIKLIWVLNDVGESMHSSHIELGITQIYWDPNEKSLQLSWDCSESCSYIQLYVAICTVVLTLVKDKIPSPNINLEKKNVEESNWLVCTFFPELVF